MAQIDIGFDTGKHLWFLSYWTSNRWYQGSIFVHDGHITLDGVYMDTYAWPDQQNDKTSHGRFRFYEDSRLETKMNEPPIYETVSISGKESTLVFTKYEVKKAVIKYKLATMGWEIKIGDKRLYTKDIKGKISGKIDNIPRVFTLGNSTILHSWLVTLINCPLEIKP